MRSGTELYAIIACQNDDGELIGVYHSEELARTVVEYGMPTWRVEPVTLDVVPGGVQASINRAIGRLSRLVPRE